MKGWRLPLPGAGIAALLGDDDCMDGKTLGKQPYGKTQCWGLTRM